jgi:hypothetical protein
MKSSTFGAVTVTLLLVACIPGTAPQETGAVTATTGEAGTTAEVAEQSRPIGDITFEPVLGLNQQPAPGQPQLRGGFVADSREWPASLYATFQTREGMAACTAAMVGPQAILTAGHCIPPSKRITARFQNQAYPAQCEIHPQYGGNRDDSADFALCKTTQAISVPAGFQFETIDSGSLDRHVGQQILLGGYGCISDAVADHRTDGLYRIGFTSIDETSNSQTRRRGDPFYAPAEKNNLLTRDDPGAANLCPGDSGGPAFRTAASASGPFASRTIIGVNSRVFYRDRNRTTYGSSLVSATGGPDFAAWAQSWRQRMQVGVCGLGGGLTNCRN